LKPENILLDFDRSLKLVDFGLSNMYEDGELLRTACGSPCYAAPEMIAGKKYQGLRTDIWSSGVVLYAMVCGYLPFEDPKTSNLYKKIMAANYQIPKFISPDCRDLLTRVLNTDPEQRYTLAQIRQHPWFNQIRERRQPGYFPLKAKMPINKSILKAVIDQHGFDPEYSARCIESNRHNHITATYNLMVIKSQRIQSIHGNLNRSIETGHRGGSQDVGTTDLNLTMPINFNPALHKDEEPDAKARFKLQIQQDLKKISGHRENARVITSQLKDSSPSPGRIQLL